MLSDLQKVLDLNRQALDIGEVTIGNPIVIKDIDDYVGVEYDLIRFVSSIYMYEPTVKCQKFFIEDSRCIDEITVSLRPVFTDASEAKDVMFYFDVTDGFGKLQESLKNL